MSAASETQKVGRSEAQKVGSSEAQKLLAWKGSASVAYLGDAAATGLTCSCAHNVFQRHGRLAAPKRDRELANVGWRARCWCRHGNWGGRSAIWYLNAQVGFAPRNLSHT